MKKFYILFFSLPLLVCATLYLPIWFSIAGLAAVLLFIAYRFFKEELDALQARNEVLQMETEDLHVRLENAVVKEQKATKETEQIRKLKQQLLTVISHEVRTPMNGIMGMTLLLEDTSLSNEQKEYTTTIRNCGENLLTSVNNMLVNDLLDFSKMQNDGKQLEYKDFALRDSVEEVLSIFAEQTGKSGIDLIYDIAPDVPEQIIGDNKRLRQVLMNLLENAVKFTMRGEVLLSVNYLLHATTGRQPELSFEIRDTGIGIAKDRLKHLFNGIPVKELKNNSENTRGLGLVICKKLVELMGGTIDVRSEEGQGSSFIFNIPLTPSLKSTREHARSAEMPRLEGKQILVVDDNASSRSAILKQLKRWKMLPVGADSAKQALELLTKNNFEVVITDIEMPEMNGTDFTKLINSQYPSLPVIAMNHSTAALPREGLFASLLSKPIRQSVLRDQLLNIFAPKNQENPTDMNSSELLAGKYPLRILVAEDNPINQKIAVKILNKLGYEPALASNGKEAMEIVGQDHYDVILMDVQMPEMDGLEASRMIRTCLEIQPVIIALTANAMQGDRDECMQAGMDDYMSKPIDLKELVSQLEKWAIALKERRKLSA
jgi:signal transduction histidine kinase/CheY-like chemotaxis protein